MASLPIREQLRRGFKDMGTRSFSSAKNFGMVGAMFAGTECCIEGVNPLRYSRDRNQSSHTKMICCVSIVQRTISRME